MSLGLGVRAPHRLRPRKSHGRGTRRAAPLGPPWAADAAGFRARRKVTRTRVFSPETGCGLRSQLVWEGAGQTAPRGCPCAVCRVPWLPRRRGQRTRSGGDCIPRPRPATLTPPPVPSPLHTHPFPGPFPASHTQVTTQVTEHEEWPQCRPEPPAPRPWLGHAAEQLSLSWRYGPGPHPSL